MEEIRKRRSAHVAQEVVARVMTVRPKRREPLDRSLSFENQYYEEMHDVEEAQQEELIDTMPPALEVNLPVTDATSTVG
jgi:hypothetical protein